MNSIESLIKKCRSVSVFKSQKVDHSDVMTALEHCLWAPNHRKTNPWKIYWPKDQLRLNFNHFLGKVKFPNSDQRDQVSSFENRMSQISEILVFSSLKGQNEIETTENYATVCCSIQLFALQLASKNIGYKWVTPKGLNEGMFHDFFSTSLALEKMVGVIWVGYPENEAKLTERPELKTILN